MPGANTLPPFHLHADTGIKSAAIVDAVLGGLMLIAFILVQSRSVLYKIRLVSPYVRLLVLQSSAEPWLAM
jgi:hypothetical protein